MNSKNNENIQNVEQEQEEERTLKALQASLRFAKERQRAYAQLNFKTMMFIKSEFEIYERFNEAVLYTMRAWNDLDEDTVEFEVFLKQYVATGEINNPKYERFLI